MRCISYTIHLYFNYESRKNKENDILRISSRIYIDIINTRILVYTHIYVIFSRV